MADSVWLPCGLLVLWLTTAAASAADDNQSVDFTEGYDHEVALIQLTTGVQPWARRVGVLKGECDVGQFYCPTTCFVNVVQDDMRFRMKVLEHDEYVSRAPLCTGKVWESEYVSTLLQELKGTTRGHILDIGANLGSWSLPVAAWMHGQGAAGAARRVIAVDANADVLNLLRESVDLNGFHGAVKIYENAVVRDVGHQKRCLSNSESGNVGKNKINALEHVACKHEVAETTLDKLYESEPALMQQVIMAKLDCEGCEGQALLGASRFLSEKPPCILAVEITEKFLCEAGTPLGELLTFLDRVGYNTTAVEIHGDGTCAGYRAWEQLPFNRLFHNYIPQSFHFLHQKDFGACMAQHK